MKKNDQYKKIILFFAALMLMALHIVVFWLVWHDYYNKMIIMPFFRRGSWVMVSIYGVLLAAFSKMYGGYRVGYYKNIDVIFSQFLGIFCTNGVIYLQISLLGLRFLNLKPLLAMTGIEILIAIIWTITTNVLFKRIYPPRRMILIYGERPADGIIHKINSRADKYQICATLNVNKGFDAIKSVIKDYEAVIIWDIPAEIRNSILKYCFGQSIRTYIMPKLSDIIVMRSDNINLFDTPLLLSRNYGLSFDQKILKRLFDILLSILALIILSPVMLITALVIKLYDKGPILYKQERLTIGGKVFNIYKFRSMVVNAEKDGVARLAGENDDRITPIGKVIRAIRLDELPQLFNIIGGSMSIVGPRPERPEIAEQYLAEMPEFEYRLKVKAGLTGYAQVYGFYNTTPYDKLKLDISYIESYSLWMDFKLILLTVKILVRREATQGISEGQVNANPMNFSDEYISTLEITDDDIEKIMTSAS